MFIVYNDMMMIKPVKKIKNVVEGFIGFYTNLLLVNNIRFSGIEANPNRKISFKYYFPTRAPSICV